MGIVGFGARGPGSGGVLPASLGQGDLLKGDGAGAWEANPNLPATVGQIPFWDGVNRYRYPAAPGNNQHYVFDTGTNLWLPVDAGAFCHVWGALNFGALASGFLYGGNWESAGANVIAAGNLPGGGARVLTRISAMGSSGPPSDCTWTIFINGGTSGVSVVQPAGNAGPVFATINLAVASLSTIAIQWTLAGATDAATRRMRVLVSGRSA